MEAVDTHQGIEAEESILLVSDLLFHIRVPIVVEIVVVVIPIRHRAFWKKEKAPNPNFYEMSIYT